MFTDNSQHACEFTSINSNDCVFTAVDANACEFVAAMSKAAGVACSVTAGGRCTVGAAATSATVGGNATCVAGPASSPSPAYTAPSPAGDGRGFFSVEENAALMIGPGISLSGFLALVITYIVY